MGTDLSHLSPASHGTLDAVTGRPWTYVAIWAAATTCAVLLSWLGVRDVLRAAVFDRPAVVQVGPVIHTSPRISPQGGSAAIGTPTSRPAPSRTPAQRTSSPSPSPSPSGKIRSFTSRGGRVALAITATDVKLVSATPTPGFRTTVTDQPFWLRVDFTDGTHTSSIIASWYEHAPIVQVYQY